MDDSQPDRHYPTIVTLLLLCAIPSSVLVFKSTPLSEFLGSENITTNPGPLPLYTYLMERSCLLLVSSSWIMSTKQMYSLVFAVGVQDHGGDTTLEDDINHRFRN